MELLNNANDTEPTANFALRYLMGKRWKKVRPGTHPNRLNETNDTIAIQYYNALRMVKVNFLKQGTPYFERDYKHDISDPVALHSFVCEQFSFYLECDYNFIMQIHYDFNDFSYMAEVLKMVGYAVELGRCIHKPQQPSLPAFFNAVVAYQDKQFIHTI